MSKNAMPDLCDLPKCSRCGLRKSRDEFYTRRESGRPTSRCKVCVKAIGKEWAQQNPDLRKGIKKRNYESHRSEWLGYKKSAREQLRASYIKGLWTTKGYPSPPEALVQLHAEHIKIKRQLKEMK